MSLTAYTDPQDARVYIEDFPELFPKDWDGTAQWYEDFKNVLSRELGTVAAAAEAASNITVESNDELLTTLGLTVEDHEWKIASLEEIIDILGGAVGVDVNAVGLTVTGNVITGTQAVAISGGPASKAYFGIQADRLRILSSTGGVTKTPFDVFGTTIRFRCPVIIETGSSGYSNISDKPTTVAEISPSEAAEIAANTLKITNATHTGDATGANALTIAANVVTNAKLADMATATIKGRTTAATGDPEDLSATSVRTLLNVADGATVGADWNTNLSSKPTALATINATEGAKLAGIADNATVGADWDTNLSNIPSYLGTPPSGYIGITTTRVGWYDSGWKTYIDENGIFYLDWGMTFGADCSIFRSAANLLKTNDDFWFGSQVWIGSTQDTNLYRAAANHLKTDDDFEAERIGINGSPDASYSLYVNGQASGAAAKLLGQNNYALTLNRNTYGATTGSHGVQRNYLDLTTATYGNPSDGFGPAMYFGHNDNGTLNSYGIMRFLRNGANNSGKILINPYTSGSIGYGLTITPTAVTAEADLVVTGSIYSQNTTSDLILAGGSSSSNGANIHLYGGSHASYASKAFYDATNHYFRSQSGSSYADFGGYGLNLPSGKLYYVNNQKVVGARGAAVAKPAATLAALKIAVDLLIDRLGSASGHGLIT